MSTYAQILGDALYVDFIFECPKRTGCFASNWLEKTIRDKQLDMSKECDRLQLVGWVQKIILSVK
jgi:hypothetical protein